MIVKPTITPNDLEQYIEKISPSDGAMSWDDSSHTIVYDIDADILYDACVIILGYAYTDDDGYLCRVNPIKHPKFQFMEALKIESIRGLNPTGKEQVSNPLANPSLADYHATYDKYRITVNFHNPLWDSYEDDEMIPFGEARDNELIRNTYIMGSEASADFITLEGGRAKFAVEAGVPVGISGKQVNAPGRAIPETKQLIKIVWNRIPVSYVELNDGIPYKMAKALQCVNSQPFLGLPAYTLLMTPYDYVRKRMPISDTDQRPDWWAEITLNLKYFDPNDKFSGAVKGGHLLAPARDGRYYHAIREDNTELLRECDFNKLFTRLSDTLVVS